jgi:hypothetical protein
MRRLIAFLAVVVGILLPLHVTFADDATVLPKGVFRFAVDARFSLPIDERYDKDGDTEDLATDFNANLNSEIFPDLALVEGAFGMPAGSATFGESEVDFERHIQIYTFQLAYGLTDRLSVGVNVPYWHQDIDVDAELDNSTATVGINPAVPGGVAPIGFPGTRPPTTEDIQAFLKSEGFREVKDWSDDGFGDIHAGARYQYHQSEYWRLAVTGTVRFPTGEWDDPNNLVDNNTGYEAWGLGIKFHQDFVWQEPGPAKEIGLPTPGSFFINTTFGYETILPDDKPYRVCDVHTPICEDFDPNVDRDVGDIFDAEISGTFGVLFEGLTFTPIYWYSHKFKDDFDGDRGFDYDLLKDETDYDSHVVEVRLSERFAGNNNQFHSRYFGFILQAYF